MEAGLLSLYVMPLIAERIDAAFDPCQFDAFIVVVGESANSTLSFSIRKQYLQPREAYSKAILLNYRK